jgi:hypothetical protein
MTGGTGSEIAFLPRLAGFVAFLRAQGVSVGTGAALDCAAALRQISLLDRRTFLDACIVTLAKTPEEIARLTRAFDLYWRADFERAESKAPPPAPVAPSPPPDGLTPAADDSRGMRMAVDRTGMVRIGVYSPDAPSAGHRLIPLDPNRVRAIRTGARRLRRYTATRPGRRERPSRHGAIDFPRTARHSLREGGEWIEFRFRKPKSHRAELFILWDVSGSMKDHEAGLFSIAHALHRGNRRTRIFAFGTQLDEITDRFRGRPYTFAASAISEDLGPAGGGTRIGLCLEDFLRRYGQFLDRRTTVVVLSDGWDLDDSPRLGRAMARLHRLSHLVVWVNPYADDPRFEPATAGMREALPHVDLLLSPADFESRSALAPGKLASRRPAARARLWGKAFIAAE